MTEQHITQGRTPLIVEKSEWKGETRLDIRLWYTLIRCYKFFREVTK